MRASISIKKLLFARVRGNIVLSLGMLTAMGCALQANPGEQYNFNHMACNLLSEVMGRVTGTPYDDLVEQRLPQPIGGNYMHNSDLLMHAGDTQAEDLAMREGS